MRPSPFLSPGGRFENSPAVHRRAHIGRFPAGQSRNQSSAEFHSAVSPISNRQTVPMSNPIGFTLRPQVENLRYSRLEICATAVWKSCRDCRKWIDGNTDPAGTAKSIEGDPSVPIPILRRPFSRPFGTRCPDSTIPPLKGWAIVKSPSGRHQTNSLKSVSIRVHPWFKKVILFPPCSN